jgi:hypothetical protein
MDYNPFAPTLEDIHRIYDGACKNFGKLTDCKQGCSTDLKRVCKSVSSKKQKRLFK